MGACVEVDRLPRSPALAACLDAEAAIALALTGGDDYELCFTVPPERLDELQARAAGWDCACTAIGAIEAGAGLRCVRADGRAYSLDSAGYDHFG